MKTWSDYLREIDAVYESGELWEEAVSDLSPGEGTRFYSDEAVDRVAEWVQEMYNFATSTGHSAMAIRLNQLCEAYTSESLPVSAFGDLTLSDFGREIEVLEDNEEPYVDPLNMRYRFQLFIEELVREARLAANLPDLGPEPRKELWSVEDIAKLEKVMPKRIRQRVSEYRSKHGGEDPAWVRRIPNKQRGFQIHWPTYKAMMKRGRA